MVVELYVMLEEVPLVPLAVPLDGAVPPDPTVIVIVFPADKPVRILIDEPPPEPPPVIVDAAVAPLPPPPITVIFALVTPVGTVNENVPVPVLAIGVPLVLVTVVGYTAVDILENGLAAQIGATPEPWAVNTDPALPVVSMLARAKFPLMVNVPEVVTGPPLKVNPVVPPDALTEVTVPVPDTVCQVGAPLPLEYKT
jgi:hypothetical protein